MDSSTSYNNTNKSNKIREIVRLQQILKKWKKVAAAAAATAAKSTNTTTMRRSSSINKFLKKTLSFTELSGGDVNAVVVPKGYLKVLCVGKEEELKLFVIPMEYLTHHAFAILLRQAEEEFGFQQEGVLKIPCEVPVFENILNTMMNKATTSSPAPAQALFYGGPTTPPPAPGSSSYSSCNSPDCDHLLPHPQLCR